MRFHIESYGCTMSHGEAEFLRRKLLCHGHTPSDEESADLNILFTCIVIESTERRMLKRLSALYGTGRPLLVSGCLASTFPEKIRAIAGKALIVPTGEIERLDVQEIVRFVETGIPPAPESVRETSLPLPEEIMCPAVSSPAKRATFIVPISEGCLGNCAYCITKAARGRLRSYPVKEIVRLVQGAVKEGYREIEITSQDTGIYGRDTGTGLPALLRELSQISKDFRIRVGMMNPAGLRGILDKLVEAYSHEKVFKFLHLPVQSGDDSILRKMKRGHTVADFEEAVMRFREAFPNMTLSTDIIVGFPGESEEAFKRSAELIERVKPDIVNITRFSPRPGTEAAKMKNRIHGWVVKERSRRLSELRFHISSEINKGFIGREEMVLVTEHGRDESMIARDNNYRVVVLPAENDVKIGEWYRVKIVGASDVYLKGEKI